MLFRPAFHFAKSTAKGPPFSMRGVPAQDYASISGGEAPRPRRSQVGIDEAGVAGQIDRLFGSTGAVKVRGRGTKDEACRAQPSGNKGGIWRLADADCQIEPLIDQIHVSVR
jgi:hypothetical protein